MTDPSAAEHGAAHSAPGYTTDDLQFKVVDTPDDYYAAEASGPVQFVPVSNADGVLGYIWGSDAEDAAGFVPRPASGDDAYNAGVFWNQKLRPFKGTGRPPSEALDELATDPGGASVGRLDGEPAKALTLPELEELAGS